MTKLYAATSILCADRRKGRATDSAVEKLELIMKASRNLGRRPSGCQAALDRSEGIGGQPAVAIQLPDGRIVKANVGSAGSRIGALLNAVTGA